MTTDRGPVTKISEVEYDMHRGDYDGLCLACGAWSCGGVEPDAEGYACEACEAPKVIGCEMAVVMGLLAIVEEP